MAKTIKTTSFNDRNPNEAAMLKHVKRKNYSGYVKRLIWEDMQRKDAQPDQEVDECAPEMESAPMPEKEMSAAERLERLKSKPKPPLMSKQPRR